MEYHGLKQIGFPKDKLKIKSFVIYVIDTKSWIANEEKLFRTSNHMCFTCFKIAIIYGFP